MGLTRDTGTPYKGGDFTSWWSMSFTGHSVHIFCVQIGMTQHLSDILNYHTHCCPQATYQGHFGVIRCTTTDRTVRGAVVWEARAQVQNMWGTCDRVMSKVILGQYMYFRPSGHFDFKYQNKD